MQILSTLSADKKRRIPAIDRALLEPIGELTVTFALLEDTLKSGIELLLFPRGDRGWEHVTTDLVTAEVPFSRLVDLLQCLFHYRCGEDSAEPLQRICQRVRAVAARRNTITHSGWGLDGESRKTIRRKSQARAKGYHTQEEIVTKEMIEATTIEMGELAKQLEDFFDSMEATDQNT